MTYLPGGRFNLTISSNTAGAGALVSTGTLTLAGGNNITLSQAGNAITISGPSASAVAGSQTIGASNLGNTVGTSGVVSGSAVRYLFAGGNNVTLSQSINGVSGTVTISAAAQTAQTQSNVQALYDGANSISTGTVRFSNSNGIGFGINGQTITASHNGITSQTNQSISFVATGNTTHNTTHTADARSITFNGLGAASVGFSNGSIELSVPTQTAQTQSNIQAIYDGANSISTGTIRFSNSNGIGFGINGQTLTASHNGITTQTVQTQGVYNMVLSSNTAGAMATISSGTMTLAGGNNITLSQNGNAVTISGGGGGAAGTNTLGASNLGNTVGTSGVITGSNLQFALAGGNNVTLSQSINASSATITISAAAQTAQTQSNIQAIYDGANSISTGTIRFSNSNGIGFGINGQTITASHNGITTQTVQTQNLFNMVLSSNTAGAMATISSGTMTLAGGNNITLSQAGNAVTISAGNGGAGGGVALSNSQAMYTSGTVNLLEGGGAITIATSAGGQSYKFSVPATSSLSATGIVSISTNGSTISIGVPDSVDAIYDGANSISTGTIRFSNSNGVSFGINGQTITASVPLNATVSRYIYPNEYIPLAAGTGVNNSISFNYVSLDQDVSASQFRALLSVNPSTHTSASTNTYALTAEVGIYTRNASTISKMSSGSQTWSGTYSSNTTGSVGGIREITMPVNIAMTPGEYWFAMRLSSSSSNASVAFAPLVVSNQITAHFNATQLGAATNSTLQLYPWHGIYTSTSGTLPTTAALASVIGSSTRGSAAMYWFDVRNYTMY